jgi:hypothetical protein
MNPPVLLLGFSAVLAAAAIGASLFAVWRAQAMAEMVERRGRVRMEELQATIGALQKACEGQSAQLDDLREQAVSATVPAAPRGGLNLGKRTQVLRMYRNGDAPDRIAAALDVPLQEVDLLVKVHRIVLSSV